MANLDRTDYDQVWSEAVARCKKTLGEEDYEIVSAVESPEKLASTIKDLERQSARGAISRILQNVTPHLEKLRIFATLVLLSMGDHNVSAALVWGVTSLLIQLASQSDQTLHTVAHLFDDLGQSLAAFEIEMQSDGVELDRELAGSFFNILVDLILDSVDIIKFFRKADDIHTAMALLGWPKVRDKLTGTLQKVRTKVEHLKRVAEVQRMTRYNRTRDAQIVNLTDRLTHLESGHPKIYSCNTLPFESNPLFYGRQEILAHITDVLADKAGKRLVRSLAIWGTGGIGKSQIALEYANQRLLEGLKVVFWVPSQTPEHMSDALSTAAQELQLDGFSTSNTPKQNQATLLSWMRRTDQEWLVVFDNLEDKDALKDAWPPSGGKGSVLITCRSEIVACSRAREVLEVPTLGPDEGGQLLAQLLRRSQLSDDEKAACTEFSERLGGLPLAIVLMGNKIRVRKRTVRSFIPSFDAEGMASLQKGRRDIGDPYYDKPMNKVWEEAFKGLAKESGQLLLLLCFFGPDNIPLSIIETEGTPDLPPAWEFLRDAKKMDEATVELMDLSLIRINETGTMISVHRLIQLGYLDSNSLKAKGESFKVAYRVLRYAFPARGRGHLFHLWGVCQPLAPHVLVLQQRYGDLDKAGFSFKEPALTVLMTDTAWYLMETGKWEVAENTLRLASEHNPDKNSIEQAEVEQGMASISVRSGHCATALVRYRRILEIRKGKFLADSNQMANAYSSIAFTLTAMYQLPEAFEYFAKVFACVNGKDVGTQRKNYNVDRFLRNRARASYYRGEFARAIEDLDEADRHQSAMYGMTKHYHGETAYIRGKVAYKQGNLVEAYNHFEFAAQAIAAGKETYRTIISTSYQQGCIRLHQGDYNGALVHLKSALDTCKINQTRENDNRDLARIQWRIAQVLAKLGKDENEARELGQNAKGAKRQMEETGLFPSPPANLGEEEEWDCFIGLLYR